MQKGIVGLLLIAATGFIPGSAKAASSLVNSTGTSDETLFIILVMIAVFQVIAITVVANVIKSLVGNKSLWSGTGSKGAGAAVITVLFLLLGGQVSAQEADFDALVSMNDTGFLALITLNLFLFAAFIYLVVKLNSVMNMLKKEKYDEVPETFIDKINTMLTDAVPVEKEGNVEMDHEYDGIRELDNNLPPWWLWGFYFCIAFAVVYLVRYHITETADLQIAEYEKEMQAAEEAKAQFMATSESTVDESNVEYLTDATTLAEGEKTFKLYCAPCHGESGGSAPGGVGPNLTDDYWIHGGGINEIYHTIKYGVPEKGMVSWEAQLAPAKIQQLASYIKSLKGTNPPNAKEPQGEIWIEEAPTPVDGEAPVEDSTSIEEAIDEELTMNE